MTTTRRGSSRGKRANPLRSSDRGTLWLMVHTPEFGSGDELVINPECFPDVQLWDLVEISQPDREHQRLILQVTALAPVRGRLQISVLKDIAAQFGLEAFYEVVVQKVDPRDITADFLELTFKDQFLSRADLWRFKVAMFGKSVYVGKSMEMLGVRSQVEALVSSNQNILCGVIGADTKMVVRSRSSRLFWLVQMSTEMWEFAPDGELYYEKLINRLLRVLIEKWNDCSVSHSLTVIAFSRSFYDKDQFPEDYDPTSPPFVDPVHQGFGPGCSAAQTGNGYGPNVHVHPINGRYFEDFYKVLVMNYTGPDWSQLSIILKREFIDYHRTHRWRMPGEVYPADYELMSYHEEAPTTDQDVANRSSSTNTKVYVKWKSLPFGVPTRATDGNILEAINVTLNILDKHYMDRDLNRTGQSIVMLTAGSGVFNVDERLAQITKQRMMDNGVGMDMISLATPPLHVVPLFISHKLRFDSLEDISRSFGDLFNSAAPPSETTDTSRTFPSTTDPSDSKATSFQDTPHRIVRTIPHWVNITFLDFDCCCVPDSTGSSCSAAPSSVPAFMRHANNNRLLAHRMYTCQCQIPLNRKFLPLPPFRMFDLTSTTDKSSFPATLANIMKQSRRRFSNRDDDEASEGTGSKETIQCARDRPPEYGIDEADGSPVIPTGQWQLSKSPDVDCTISQGLAGAMSLYSSGTISRDAFHEYDDEVFSFSRSQENEENHRNWHSHLRPSESDADLASRTFNGEALSTHLSKADRWKSLSSHGVLRGSSSIIQSILSPRTTVTTSRASLSRKVKRVPTVGALSSALAENFIAGSGQTSSSQTGADSSETRGGSLSEIPGGTHHPRRSFTTIGNFDETRGRRNTSDSLKMLSSIHKNETVNEKIGRDTRSAFIDVSTKQCEDSSTIQDIPMTKLPLTPASHQGRQVVRSSPPPRHPGISSPTPPLSGSYQKSFLTGNGFQPAIKRSVSDNLSITGAFGSYTPTSNAGALLNQFTTSSSEVNPFRYSNETVESATARITSDRRRWTHLFPTITSHCQLLTSSESNLESDVKQIFLGPNWTSLTSPAILPLTTDYYPTPKDLYANYTESFYTLTLPSADMDVFPKYKNHDELLIEMVCQRLAGDFQLVATDAGTDVDVSRNRVPAGTMNRGPSGESRDVRSNTVTYHLSMGHRIHQIIYDAELQTIEVKRYFERASQGEHNEPKVYNYSLWVEHTQSFQPLQQKFYQYPMPEDNWNSLDHLLCGYHDEMFDTTKCRRIRFAIVPPSSVSASTASVADKMAYVEKFTRFIEYLQSRVGPQGGVQEHIVVQIVMERPPTSSLRSQNRMLSFKMSCETLSSYTRLKSGDSRKEWVMIRVEDTMFVYKCFHFDVRWLACSGIVVDDFISTVKRKAKQAGLELRRVPEYSSVSFLQIHALVAPIFLPMPLAIMCNSEQERTLVAILTSRLDFVLDDERLADAIGIGYGLGLGEEVRPSGTGFQRFSQGRFLSQAAKEARLAEKWRKRGYKQYMHRRVPVFLRLIHNGIVWIPGYDYDQLSSFQQTHDLFKEICTAIETCSNLPSSCCGSEAA